MRKFLSGVFVLSLAVFASCSTNEIKKTAAEQIGSMSKEVLKSELVKSCDEAKAEYEAVAISAKIQIEVEKLFKVENSAQKSFAGDIVQITCKVAISKVLPTILESNYEEYECAMKRFYERSEEFSESVCEKIKF